MPDIIGTITGLITLAQKALQATDALKASDLKLQIAQLVSDLADLKVKCADLVSENDQLKRELQQARRLKAAKAEFRGDTLYFDGDGPYCTACWNNNQKQIRLKEGSVGAQQQTGQKYVCPICKIRHKGCLAEPAVTEDLPRD
jgi:hypothetical protein